MTSGRLFLVYLFFILLFSAAINQHKQDALPFEVASRLVADGASWSDVYLPPDSDSVFRVSGRFLVAAHAMDPVFDENNTTAFLSWPGAIVLVRALGGSLGLGLLTAAGAALGLKTLNDAMGNAGKDDVPNALILVLTGLLLTFGVAIGQTSPLLLLVVLAPATLAIPAGLALGVLICTKAWPALLLPVLAWQNKSAATTATAFAATLNILAFMLWGDEPFTAASRAMSHAGLNTITSLNALSVESLLLRDGVGTSTFVRTPILLGMCVGTAKLGTIAVAAWKSKGKPRSDLLAAVTLVCAPLGWTHYFTVLPVALLQAPRWVTVIAVFVVVIHAIGGHPTPTTAALATLTWLAAACYAVAKNKISS